MRILLLFLDGIGLGDDNPAINPFAVADLPTLWGLTNRKRWLRSTGLQISERAIFIPTDACLAVPGRPQSGTGQAVIVTGLNVPQMIGEHYGPKPSAEIRTILDQDNIFRRIVARGKSAALLEAYPPSWHKHIDSGKRLPSSYQYAARTASVLFRGEAELRAGTAISGDWTGQIWRTHLGYTDIPVLTPIEAGMRLVEIARRYDFSFSSHWISDYIGHRGNMEDAVGLLETFDSVMAGILTTWNDDEGLVIVASDHGNLEEIGNRHHTQNKVPTLVIGRDKELFLDLTDLTGLAPRLEQGLFGSDGGINGNGRPIPLAGSPQASTEKS